ncbi:uncharacterized protein Triagg1_9406 [Trichoderma aggressivum f. europaeum]|uniref:FAD-binding FR-type domain-containing protein n=1 Tax=Trichoderma aggressivum f. europaeum TaxID=173218 RepID=A0AAE1LX55_9HYPO|nr:hypothetical protein Triagg1_9406 [Trichoderma aggressivum f. europaeum]
MDMGSGSPSSSAPLTPAGVDFSNETQASDFLQEILDDSVFGPIGNKYARYFWYGVVVVIGIASICNVVQRCVLRMRASARNRSRPAKPASPLTQSIATASALLREPSYPQIIPLAASSWFKVPPLGHVYIITSYLAFIFALVFVNNNNNNPGAQHFQALSIRAGWLGAAQVPLLVLTSSKTSIIGFLVNSSVERLNVYHRWSIYGLMVLEWKTDECTPTGISAYALLLWMNLTSLAPLRFFKYEIFVVQHLLTYFGFTIAIVYHLNGTSSPYSTNYIYISIALYMVGQLIRFVRMVIVNIRPSRAVLTPLEGSATKIRLSNSGIKSWQAGSYVHLFIPRFNIVLGHPATILSTPSSHGGDMVFILRSFGSFTKRLLKAAQLEGHQAMQLTLIDGPYPSQEAGVETLCNIHITGEEGTASDEESAGSVQLQEQEKEQDGEVDGRPVLEDDKAEASKSWKRRTSTADVSFAELHMGRPTFRTMLERRIHQAQGETAVAVCGPLGLSVAVRSAVVRISDDLAVDKGSGLDGLYLHVENFD